MNELSSEKWGIIDEIVAYIYDADPLPDLQIVIQNISKLLHFSNSMSCLASDIGESLTFFDFRSSGIPQEHITAYCTHYIHYDFLQWFSAAPFPIVCRATDIIVQKYMESSIFMKQWLAPLGIHYGLLVNIAANDHLYANIVFYRSKDEGNFSEHDISIMNIINRHLCSCFKTKYPKGIYYNSKGHSIQGLQHKFGLSDRENEIVQMICQGTPRNKLSESLFICNSTLKNYLSSIYNKMEISSYGDLINLLLPHFDLSANIKNVQSKTTTAK